jgi:hypothetical protein
MQNNRERVDRFIEAFKKFYGRKPQAEDADGDFKIQVVQDKKGRERGRPFPLCNAE